MNNYFILFYKKNDLDTEQILLEWSKLENIFKIGEVPMFKDNFKLLKIEEKMASTPDYQNIFGKIEEYPKILFHINKKITFYEGEYNVKNMTKELIKKILKFEKISTSNLINAKLKTKINAFKDFQKNNEKWEYKE